jgi:predicted  nucleic acid-binding Zn-ribbon protein
MATASALVALAIAWHPASLRAQQPSTCDSLAQQVQTASQKNQQAQQTLSSLQAQLATVQTQVNEANSQLQTQQADFTAEVATIDVVASALSAAGLPLGSVVEAGANVGTAQELQQALDSLEQEASSAVQALDKVQEIGGLVVDILADAAGISIEDLVQQAQQVQQQASSAQSQVAQIAQQQQTLTQQVQALNAQIQTAMQSAQSAMQSYTQLQDQYKQKCTSGAAIGSVYRKA